jgi:hypothetical protein
MSTSGERETGSPAGQNLLQPLLDGFLRLLAKDRHMPDSIHVEPVS